MMDKIKHIPWVGEMYQKIEAMFEEIDDILSQNAVKYDEDEVQTGDESEEKLCSNFVQQAHAASVERNNATGSYNKAGIDIENNLVGSYIQQSHVKDNDTENVKTQLGHASSGVHLVNSLSTSPNVDSQVQTESDFSKEQIDEFLASKMLDISVDENAMKEKSSVPEVLELISLVEKKFEASLFNEFIDDNHENNNGFMAEVSPSSVQDLEFGSPEGTVSAAFSDCTYCDFDASSTPTSSGMDFPVVYSCMNNSVTRGFDHSSSVLSLETLEEDTSWTKETVPLTGASGNMHAQLNDSTAVISTSDIGCSDDFSSSFTVQEMETTELGNSVKIDESCVIVDSSDLYDVPHKDQKRGSYKERLLDAFSMKKKSVKYEQLADLHGDIDSRSPQNTADTLLQSNSTIIFDSKSLQTNHTSDSEWEFVS